MVRGQIVQDRYEVEDYRASNSAVELYDAVDTQLDRPVTLQIVHEALVDNAELANAFEAHQKIGLSLYNCSVLAIYDVGIQDGRAFSVMERFRPLVPADFRLRDGSPDLPVVLRITRQVAAGLECCREAGLVDWAFTPEMVGLDGEGDARLAIIEGPVRVDGAVAGSADVEALGSFLRGLLASGEASDNPVLPVSVETLFERLEGRVGEPFVSAGELASSIEVIELAGSDPTQAYLPETDIRTNLPEPLTFASPVVSAIPVADIGNKATQDLTVVPFATVEAGEPVEQPFAVPAPENRRGTNRPVLMGLIGLVAAILLLFGVLPRLVDGRGESATSGLTIPTPTVVPLVAAPDLKGMKLEEAQVLAGGYRLTVDLGAAGEDKTLPPDTVLTQEPLAGTLVQSGSVITVSLNVVTQVQPPVPPTAVPAQNVQPAAEQPPDVKGAEHGKKEDENKGNDKDKGKDK